MREGKKDREIKGYRDIGREEERERGREEEKKIRREGNIYRGKEIEREKVRRRGG